MRKFFYSSPPIVTPHRTDAMKGRYSEAFLQLEGLLVTGNDVIGTGRVPLVEMILV